MKIEKIVGLVFSVIGIGLLLGDIYAYKRTSRFIGNSEKAGGVVTELVKSYSGRSGSFGDSGMSGSPVYAPVVRFKTPDGREFEFKSAVSSNPPSYSAGDSVEVLYDKNNPASAEINGFFSLWFTVLILSFLGALFSGIGLTILKFSR